MGAGARIAFVDMLRGVAALTVLFHHAFVWFPASFAAMPAPALRLCAWLSERNHEAVLLFFVVSGFSIRLSVERLDLRRAADLNEYVYRRLKRILPLYLAALAFSAACAVIASVPVGPEALGARTLLGNLLFLQTSAGVPGNWFEPFAGNGPLWSLSYEMFYYVLFPLHLRSVKRAELRFAAALAISAVGLVANRAWPNPLGSFAASYLVWYAGVEVAEAYLGRARTPRFLPWASWLGLVVSSTLVASATLSALLVGVTLLLLGRGLVAAPALHRLARAPVCRAAIAGLAWVGGFSYALYLLHFPLLRAVAHALGTAPAWLWLAVGASGALALVAERLSLRPRYELLRRRYVR